METEKQSLGFFDQVILSVQPKRYCELITRTGKQVLAYVLVLSLCLSIMQFLIPTAGWFLSFGGLDNLFTEVLPAIELQNGKLSVEDKIEIGENSATYILIDTERVAMQESDLKTEEYLSEILVAEENMIIYTSGMGVMEMRFEDLGNISLTNETLRDLKPVVYLTLSFAFFAQIASGIFDLLIWGVLMAVCCWGPFRLKGTEKIAFTKIMTLAIYAQTAAKLVTAFNASAHLIKDNFIVYYVGMMVSMLLLMNGLRKMEAETHE